jgi:hypothetical protein
MEIKKEHENVIIDALVTKIKSLELEVWLRDERIKELTAKLKDKVTQNG